MSNEAVIFCGKTWPLETVSLRCGNADAGDDDLRVLAKLVNLTELDLTNVQVSDLAPLAELENLEVLTLRDMPVADLTPLSQFTNLEALYLQHTNVTDLGPLAGLLKLEELDLSGTPVADLSPLTKLRKLERLSLGETLVSDLSPLAELTALKGLHLGHTRVSDLRPLAMLAKLKWLTLSGTQVAELDPLAMLASLETLELSETRVSNLGPLANLGSLRQLFLNRNQQVSDIGPLSELLELETLRITETNVSDLTPLFAQLAQATRKKLKKLSIEGSPVPESQIDAIETKLPSLFVDVTRERTRAPLKKIIFEAFKDVTLNGGIGVRQAIANDDWIYGEEAALIGVADTENWWEIPDEWREQLGTALTFTDDNGFLFLLPAEMWAEIDGVSRGGSIFFHLCSRNHAWDGPSPTTGSPQEIAYLQGISPKPEHYAFTPTQFSAVASYFRWWMKFGMYEKTYLYANREHVLQRFRKSHARFPGRATPEHQIALFDEECRILSEWLALGGPA